MSELLDERIAREGSDNVQDKLKLAERRLLIYGEALDNMGSDGNTRVGGCDVFHLYHGGVGASLSHDGVPLANEFKSFSEAINHLIDNDLIQ